MNTPNDERQASAGQVERPVRPLAWALTHTDGRVTLHLDTDYATAYRDTCVKETPLYAPQEEADFTVLAGDEDGDELDFVAGSSGPRQQALREALHYAQQYARDGRVEVHELIRIPLLVLPAA